jgi:hypothetical protein
MSVNAPAGRANRKLGSVVSTDSIVETNEYRSGVGAHWPFLSDVRRLVQKDLDIAEYTDPAHNPMIPHVIILEPDLRR